MKKFLLALYFYLQCFMLWAQVTPAEGAYLNYRLVGFSVPLVKGESYYFEVAKGYFTSEDEFEKNILYKFDAKENKIIKELPFFEAAYTWRFAYSERKSVLKKRSWSTLQHFIIGGSPFIDTTKYRLRIIGNVNTHKDLLLVTDSRVMYDINGSPLWYLPDIKGKLAEDDRVRDLKLTSFGTFTFLKDNDAYEVDYNGKLLWSAPHGIIATDNSESYHHEFTRLGNGNYMIAGQQFIPARKSGEDTCSTTPCGTLIEYGKEGNIIWYWKSANYLLNNARYASGGFMHTNPHLNSFYFDEDKKHIYVSFRNLNTILKLEYPSGKVLADYYQGDNGLFFHQHGCRVNSDGLLYLYSNNAIEKSLSSRPSEVIKLKQDGKKLLLDWSFPCDIDKEAAAYSSNGGSVYELDDNSLLTCMGAAGRVFIVSQEKTMLWNAIAEVHRDSYWSTLEQYRISVISSPQALHSIIFRE